MRSSTIRGVLRTLRWSLPFFASILPITLLSLYSYRIGSDSVAQSVENENLSAASNLSQLITQDVVRTLSLAHAVATLPGTAEAFRQGDEVSMANRLQAVVLSYPYINRAFVTDASGRLWSDYPPVPEAKGKPLGAGYAWAEQADEKSAASDAYESPLEGRGLVIGIATPVSGEDGRRLGTLVFEYDLTQVTEWIQSIRVGHGGGLYLLDPSGALAAHATAQRDVETLAYQRAVPLERARDNEFFTQRYVDPIAGEEMVATFQPLLIGQGTWVVVSQQPVRLAFASLQRVKWNIGLAGGLLTLLTFGMIVALARTSARNERLNRQLSDANKALQDFASIVSHQLKAPIASMGAVLECVFDGTYGPLPKELEEPLSTLREVNDRNHGLIMDILNMSRIDRGVVSVDLKPVSAQDVMEDAVKHYREPAANQGITVTVQRPSAAILLLADKEKLVEAVGNSVSNALKHTPKGGSITLSVRVQEGKGVIDVTDTGEGMPPELVAKLFSKDQIFGKNTSAESSAGLGLYIAVGFMKLQNGSIAVASEPGKGTTFSYAVPLAPSA